MIFCKQYYNNSGSLSDILYNSLCIYGNHNNFRIVNTGVGKYISVQNKDTQTYSIALNFGSYDYMGMTNKLYNREHLVDLYDKYQIQADPELINKLENKITEFLEKNTDINDTIVINGGYQANSLYLPLILESYDLVLSDSDNHASIIKGLKRSSKIQKKVFKHISELEQLLKTMRINYKNIIVIVEGIYSMQGSILDLNKYLALKKIYGFHLYIDEAHSCGSLGHNQGGICDYYGFKSDMVEYLMGTFSKTFNSHGSYICGPTNVINKLKTYRNNKGYNTYPAVSTQHVLSIYEYLANNHLAVYRQTNDLITYAYNSIITKTGLKVISNPSSPVICIQITYGQLQRVTRYFIKHNIAIVCIGYPAVKLPYSIIRICISTDHTYDDIDYLVSCIMLNADMSKLVLPARETLQIVDNSYVTNKPINYTLTHLSFGTSGPPAFFGYLAFTVLLEELVSSITKKNTTLCLPHATSGYYDIFENIVKRYGYVYICVKNTIDPFILECIKHLTTCKIVNEHDNIDKNTTLYIDYEPTANKKHCLKIMTDFNTNTNIANYTFVIGSFEQLCKGMGCFLSYDEHEYSPLRKRTVHSSYVFSATLPAYIIHHNIREISNQIC
uniref:Aminotransferase class I/classII large domain-containing protein n=1 Tax=viral metagenome TaxID=1070528 RepID=A0A6C0IJA6_9ZZZZ